MPARAAWVVGAMAWSATGAALTRSARVTVPGVLAGSAGPDDAVAALAAVLALGVLAWLALAVVVTALTETLPRGGRVVGLATALGSRITPALLRRAVVVGIAGALVTGVAPAQAAAAAPERPDVVATAPADLDPSWAAVPPAVAAAPTAPTSTPAAADEVDAGLPLLDPSWGSPARARQNSYPDDGVVVRRGDTLWDLAARQLGPTATDAEIAHAWPRWFAANRATIGPDPDHLTPGQRLHPPAHAAGGL